MNGFQNSRATFDPIDRLKLGPVPEHPIVQKDKAKLKLG